MRNPVITPERCNRCTRSVTAGEDIADPPRQLGHRHPRVVVQLLEQPDVDRVDRLENSS